MKHAGRIISDNEKLTLALQLQTAEEKLAALRAEADALRAWCVSLAAGIKDAATMARSLFVQAEQQKRAHVSAHYQQKMQKFDDLLSKTAAQFSGMTAVRTDEWERASKDRANRPNIVCLCGSTRFYEKFMEHNYLETMHGNIVLSVGFFMHRKGDAHGESSGCTPEQKIALDELHKRKIDLADEVFVLNVGGYIGKSTRSEIDYAEAHRKPIRYLEPIDAARSAGKGEQT